AAAARARAGPRAEAGVDAGRAVRRAGNRRAQLRPRRDGVRAPAGRADPDREPARGVRDAGQVPLVINPVLAEMAVYPFTRLEEERQRLLAAGVDVIDFGKGDPNEPTDPMIRQALVEALPERSPYPLAQGLPELREAAAHWCATRFGAEVDPDTEIVPTYGSKEAIFSLAQVLDTAGRTVVFGEPAYPVYERGALFAGARVQTMPLVREHGFLPDLDAIPDDTALVWVNYPHNPTGAVAPLEFFDRLARVAAERDFYLGSDEAYTELWFDAPPAS